jgi:serine/threonine protein kinase
MAPAGAVARSPQSQGCRCKSATPWRHATRTTEDFAQKPLGPFLLHTTQDWSFVKMDVAASTVLLGKYRVDHLIGQGGMGNVYAATHLTMGRQVAIKLLREELHGDAELVERFSREVVATARVRNPYVVSVHDVDRLEDGTLFIVMDRLRGETLRQRMDRGPISSEECVDILTETAAALAGAHQAGVVHRDLKPENIFLISDPVSQVKVVDFGIAKLEDTSSITATSTMLGTPAYTAPEQLLSLRNAGPHSDVWSLGVVAFELFAGRPPFHADSMPGLCAAILTGGPPRAEELAGVDEGLRTAILGCLERDPELRCQSATAFARAIAPHGSSRAQAALAVAEATLALKAEGLEPASTSTVAPPAVPASTSISLANTQPVGVEAQPSVRASHASPARARRWPYLAAAGALLAGVLALGFREGPAEGKQTIFASAATALFDQGAASNPKANASAQGLHQPSARFLAEPGRRVIRNLSFSADGQLITTHSSESGRVRIWDLGGQTELRGLPAEAVESVYLGANNYALTKTSQGTLTQWSLMSGVSTGAEKLQTVIGFVGATDFGVVAVTADRQVVTMSDLGRTHHVTKLPVDPSGILTVRADGKRALIGTATSSFLYVDLGRQQVIKLDPPSSSALSAALFLPQRQGVITGDHDGRIMIWLPPAQAPEVELPRVDGPVLAISASGDGQRVLVASSRQLLLYEPETQRTRLFVPAGPAISIARLSSDGSQLAVGNKDGEVLVYPISAFD